MRVETRPAGWGGLKSLGWTSHSRFYCFQSSASENPVTPAVWPLVPDTGLGTQAAGTGEGSPSEILAHRHGVRETSKWGSGSRSGGDKQRTCPSSVSLEDMGPKGGDERFGNPKQPHLRVEGRGVTPGCQRHREGGLYGRDFPAAVWPESGVPGPGQPGRPLVGLFAQIQRVTGTDAKVRAPPSLECHLLYCQRESPLNWGFLFFVVSQRQDRLFKNASRLSAECIQKGIYNTFRVMP